MSEPFVSLLAPLLRMGYLSTTSMYVSVPYHTYLWMYEIHELMM